MNKNSKKVLEGILDSAASEYLEENTLDVQAVHRYAENGCNINLTDDEATVILEIARKEKEKRDELWKD